MKNLVARTLASLLLGVLTLGSTAQAQRTEQVIKANIPFEFVVGSRFSLPGRYSVVSTAPVFLDLRDAQGRTLATVLTNSVETLQVPVSPNWSSTTRMAAIRWRRSGRRTIRSASSCRSQSRWTKMARAALWHASNRRREQPTVDHTTTSDDHKGEDSNEHRHERKQRAIASG